ncbi:MAG TPA: hypothetical protein VK901_12915 [Nitrospiraceae bacterium]|nr:hypothetical protein [Nitrospiraceae bacterium]
MDLELTNRHVPYFVSNFLSSQNPVQALPFSTAVVLLQTKGVVATLPQLLFNTSSITAFPADQATGLPGAAVPNVQLIQKHTITVVNAGSLAPAAGPPGNQATFDESKLADILLRVTLKLP